MLLLYDLFLRPVLQPALALAWSPDGQLLAVGYGGYGNSPLFPPKDQDLHVRLWAWPPNGTAPVVLSGPQQRILALTWHPTGRSLYANGELDQPRLWISGTWGTDLPFPPVPGYTHPDLLPGYQDFATSPDGHWLVTSGGRDQIANLWDIQDPQQPHRIEQHPPVRTAHEAQFLPNSSTLVLVGAATADTSAGRIWFWDLTQPDRPLLPLDTQGEDVNTIAVSGTGSWLVGETVKTSQVRLWDLAHPNQRPVILSSGTGTGGSPHFSADEHWFATTAGQQVLVWDLHQLQNPPQVLLGAEQRVNRVAFHPNSRYLAGSGETGVVYVWDLQAPTNPPILLRH